MFALANKSNRFLIKVFSHLCCCDRRLPFTPCTSIGLCDDFLFSAHFVWFHIECNTAIFCVPLIISYSRRWWKTNFLDLIKFMHLFCHLIYSFSANAVCVHSHRIKTFNALIKIRWEFSWVNYLFILFSHRLSCIPWMYTASIFRYFPINVFTRVFIQVRLVSMGTTIIFQWKMDFLWKSAFLCENACAWDEARKKILLLGVQKQHLFDLRKVQNQSKVLIKNNKTNQTNKSN